jgi:hypothetical protein
VRIDAALARPFDPKQAEQHDRDQWGLSPEAIASAAAKDAMFGDVSYE